MITPFEIESKEFSKSVRGYNAEEVDLFLDEIMLDYEKLIEDNKILKAKVDGLTADLESYKKSESSVLNTLESAKHLMSDISASAEKRAEIILKNARLDAEVIQREAKDSIEKLTDEGKELKNKVARYRERYRQLLEDELGQLEGSSATLFADLEKDFLPASMEEKVSTEEVKVAKPKEEPSAVDMIMEDLKNSSVDSSAKTRIINTKEDMTKTRIL